MYTADEIQRNWDNALRDLLQGKTIPGFALRYADSRDEIPGGALSVLDLGYTIAYLMGVRFVDKETQDWLDTYSLWCD